jgi:hypothetical protein
MPEDFPRSTAREGIVPAANDFDAIFGGAADVPIEQNQSTTKTRILPNFWEKFSNSTFL